jgi:hypothetical protein
MPTERELLEAERIEERALLAYIDELLRVGLEGKPPTVRWDVNEPRD